jgi:hypothetical protein
MHCKNTHPYIDTIIRHIPYINENYNCLCNDHYSHHDNVKSDLELDNDIIQPGLYMNHNAFTYISICTLISLYLAKVISNYNISIINIIVISCVLSYSWILIWNHIHPQMHSYRTEYKLIDNILLNNHKKHHLQKSNKGNYNVIVLGADIWFNCTK